MRHGGHDGGCPRRCGLGKIRHRDRGFSHCVRRLQQDRLGILLDVQNEIESRPNSFFNVTVVARSPEKATPEGNRYLQKFVKRSAWKPRDLKCFAGKVDYPNWNFFERMMIRIIMKITNGPTDSSVAIDYTDYNDVKAYARHCLQLDKLQARRSPRR